MGLAANVSGDVSPGLAAAMRATLNNPEGRQPPTLRTVLNAVDGGLLKRLIEERTITTEDEEDISKELDALIERHGSDVLTQNFVGFRASENLAIVIRTVMAERDPEEPPTLGAVFETMQAGLVAQLVGRGEIDPDDDETLITEIQNLIEIYNQNALAEDFLP